MESAEITSAKYCTNVLGTNTGVVCVFDGKELIVPLDPANRHYAEIMRQVDEGTLTIQDADD